MRGTGGLHSIMKRWHNGMAGFHHRQQTNIMKMSLGLGKMFIVEGFRNGTIIQETMGQRYLIGNITITGNEISTGVVEFNGILKH